jgi:hypothetical protein
VNINKEPRRQRRNLLSRRAFAAIEQVYDLAQTEALAEENEMRTVMYETLAHLTGVNGPPQA